MLNRCGVIVAVSAACIASTSAGARAPAQPMVEAVVRQAGEYVTRFVRVFSNVVAEEHYVQNVMAGVPSGLLRSGGQRELRSDLLLVRVPGEFEWRPFRDVFEVGGTPVRDRDERLARLFLGPPLRAIEQASRIAEESARYNIGMVLRTVNTPVHTLLFLQPALQPRFRFTLGGRGEGGANVWIVRYVERGRPTLIRGTGDTDLPATGRFWIDADSGTVLRAELVMTAGTGTARITTSFRPDEASGLAVPADMLEEYQLQRGRVVATATYSHFRQFAVSTDTEIASPRP